MKLIKSILTMAAALAATVGYAGDSAPFRLDTSTSPVGDSISISWDASWIGGNANATVVIKDNGTEVKRTTGAGQFTYSLSSSARHELTYTTLIGGVVQSEVYTASVYGKWKYDVVDGGAVITDITQTSGSITIPATIDGYPVTGITDGLFEGCTGLTGVSLPGSLLSGGCSANLSTNGWKLLSKDSDGTEEYQSAAIGNSASTSMSLSLDGPYDLTFSWKVSSESGYDYLRWYLDGTEKSKISGTGGTWQNVPVSVPAGEHTIQWTYSKDSSSASGSDCGWVKVKRPTGGGAISAIFPDSYATLQSVTLTGATTEIPAHALEGCAALTSFNIPLTVTNIGTSAFADCTSLTSVMIPGSVKQIGEGAFAGCSSLAQVSMPSWFEGSLPANVFEGCPSGMRTEYNIFAVSFNANGGSVGETSRSIVKGNAIGTLPTPTRTGYMFAGWWTAASGGTQISASTTVTENVTYYAHWTVNQYTVTFNANGGTSGTTKTQDYGTSLSAPTVTRTGYTFTGWSPSVPSTMPAGDTTYTAQWQINQYTVTFDANGGAGGWSKKLDYGSAIVAPVVTREWYNYTWSPAVPATVPANDVTYTAQWQRYGDSIFDSKMGGKTMKQLYPSDYANMTTVVLEEGILELPAGFFDGCDNVVNLTLPESLREFGFDDLPSKIRASLKDRYDANGFKIYGNWILDYQNRNAAAVTIPEGIVGIGRGAFKEMFDLETVTMPESLRCIASGAFKDCSYIQELQFMSGLRYVGQEAFSGCSSLLTATFADGVEHIGIYAFEDCWQMQSVRLPFTVTDIGYGAFFGCTAIRGVTVPTQIETMQDLFPAAYSQIETAEVAEGETAVMDDMFAGCVALRGGATQTDMSMIPNTVTNIGARAFQGCTSLTAFVVPDSVAQIGVSVFQGCSSLWNVTLSRSLTEIPDYAFYGCSMLETMVVPENVTYLGNRFFSGKYRGDNALYYLCTNAPDYDASAYAAISGNMTTYVLQNSRSWDGRQGSRVLPQSWNGYAIEYWTPIEFEVTFDANGGRFDSSGGSTWSELQIKDTAYALPSKEPVRPGWAFEGWWTEQTGGAEVRYTTKVTATRTHTLYAHWRSLGERMTVTFNSNGGRVVTPGSQDYVSGQTFGQFPVPTRRGYTFLGWWTEAAGGRRMTEETPVPDADMELFAHWSPITYYVRFHANGGTGTMTDQPFIFDARQALKTCVFTRTGFAFTGWATSPDGQVRYAGNASVVNLEEVQDKIVDLYAVWSGVGYSVRFDSNGGTGIMGNQTIAVGETQNLWPCVFARAGYTFVGWALSPTEAEAKKVAYRDGQAVRNLATSNGADVPLYAVWVAKSNTVRITFDANGGSVAPDYWDCVVNTAVEAFPLPTRPGFTFAGWWTARTGGTRVASIASATSSRTFYAHWTRNGDVDPGDGSYTVTFNANGGSVSPTSRTVAKNATVGDLPTPVRTGYAFVGWFTAASGGTQVSANTKVTSSVTYYAHWAVNLYTVAFNANGGNVSEPSRNVAFEDAVGELPAPVRSGYTFVGWFTAVSGGVQVYAWTVVTGDVMYYAHWTENGGVGPVVSTCKVTFNANGGSVSPTSRTVAKNATVGDLPTPVRTGFTFAGWWTAANGGVQVNASTKVTSSVTYYAHWTVNQYTVTFNANGGTGGKSMKQNYGSAIVAPTVTRTGYTFAGWSPAVAATVPANNVTYNALWTKNQTPTPTPTPTPEETPVLFEEVEGEAPATASEYNGYLYDEKSGAVKGTIQVKVGKPGKKDGKATVKATVVVGTKKITLKGAEMGKAAIASDGPTKIDLVGKGAEECGVMLGAYGITGYYGAYVIDGARNIFSSKDKGDLAEAKDALDKCLGSRMVIWDGGSVSVSIAAKGKVKVSGTLASGAKVSATAVLLVGEEWNCVSVSAPKANLSFVLWLSRDGKTTMVDGLGDDVLVGNAGTLADGAVFSVSTDAALWSAIPGEVLTEYLPNGVPVTKKGTKWTLPKVGRITMKKGVIDVSKAGENPSGLKLAYKAKDGTFKGSFKVYAENKGKLKATTVNVTGFLLNGIGFGTATIKKVGSISIRIE